MATQFDIRVMIESIGSQIRDLDLFIRSTANDIAALHDSGRSSDEDYIGMMLESNALLNELDSLWYAADRFNWSLVGSIGDDIEVQLNSLEHDYERFFPYLVPEIQTMRDRLVRSSRTYYQTVVELVHDLLSDYIEECDDCEDVCACQFYENIDWDFLERDLECVPMCLYMICPDHAPYTPSALANLEHSDVQTLLSALDEFYVSDPVVGEHKRCMILGYSDISVSFVDSIEMRPRDWYAISQYNKRLMESLDEYTFSRWQDRLDWNGKALNEVLTPRQFIQMQPRTQLMSFLEYTDKITLDMVKRGNWTPDQWMIILRKHPITLPLVNEVLKLQGLDRSLIWFMQSNPHLTPEIAYHFRDLFFSLRAKELENKFRVRATVYSKQGVPPIALKMIMAYLE